ncbi:hypothetical protein GCM10010216_40520 [Streptomyces flaveolus]|nr:hypothetical protein GCM10010216_40520 [Streptomyces flaveolus]
MGGEPEAVLSPARRPRRRREPVLGRSGPGAAYGVRDGLVVQAQRWGAVAGAVLVVGRKAVLVERLVRGIGQGRTPVLRVYGLHRDHGGQRRRGDRQNTG